MTIDILYISGLNILCIADLKSQANLIIDQALAPSTKKAYKRSMDLFHMFASSIGKSTKQCLKGKYIELWLAQLSSKGLRHNTIRSHLSAVRYHCTRHDIPHSLNSPRIRLLLKGLERNSATATTSAATMTTKHLKLLIKVSSALQNKKDHYQFIAMLAVAFYGFLRPSEYCITPSNHHLNWNNVQFSKKGKQVRLFLRSFKHSKGKSTIVLHPAKICCPIYWLKRYRSLFTNCHHTPLFDMTAKDFHRVLKNLCDTAKIKTKLTPHSLRHGGASWASKQGWPDARIKAHGRWRSDAYKRYVRAF